MKSCARCSEDKPATEFYTEPRRTDGYDATCKQCRRTAATIYRRGNIEKVAKVNAAWQRANPSRCNAATRKWQKANPDTVKRAREIWKTKNPGREARTAFIWRQNHKEQSAVQSAKWAEANPDRRNAITARRRARKLQATPTWANKKYIDIWYKIAKLEEAHLGVKCHVDHIVPLKHKLVCGLHNEFNLQVLTYKQNQSKSNRWEV